MGLAVACSREIALDSLRFLSKFNPKHGNISPFTAKDKCMEVMMKRYYLFAILFSALVCLSALDIHSTTAGGSWNQTATWVEGQVPGPDDNVWINGPVKVTNNSQCHDLYISDGCLLRNKEMYRALYIGGDLSNHGSIAIPSHYLTIYLYGNLINRGTISNGPGNFLSVYCHGDLANYGTINNSYFYIQSDQDQCLLMAEGSSESCVAFYLVSDVGVVW